MCVCFSSLAVVGCRNQPPLNLTIITLCSVIQPKEKSLKSLLNTVHHSPLVVIDKAKLDGCIRIIRLSVTGFSLCIVKRKKKEAKDNASTHTWWRDGKERERAKNVNWFRSITLSSSTRFLTRNILNTHRMVYDYNRSKRKRQNASNVLVHIGRLKKNEYINHGRQWWVKDVNQRNLSIICFSFCHWIRR